MEKFDLDVLLNEYSYTELIKLKTMLTKIIDNLNRLVESGDDIDDFNILNIINNIDVVINNVKLIEEAISVKTIVTFESICLN